MRAPRQWRSATATRSDDRSMTVVSDPRLDREPRGGSQFRHQTTRRPWLPEWSYDSRTNVLHWAGAGPRPTVPGAPGIIDLDVCDGLVLQFDESNGQNAGLTITGVRKHLEVASAEERTSPKDIDRLGDELGRVLETTRREDVDASRAIRPILRIFDAPRSIRAADAYVAD